METRDKLVRELAAMDPNRHEKVLSSLGSKTRHRDPQAVNETFSDVS
jgi:hypothetical protein